MTVRDAVIQILQSAGKPLHAKEIAERVIKEGLWHYKGKTPPGTVVGARLYSDINKRRDKSVFVKVSPQTFALRDSTAEKTDPEVPHRTTRKRQDQPPSANTRLPFKKCAQKVLETFGNKQPMHYKTITDKALQKGWLVTIGQTPENTMLAQIITDINRQQKRGEQPQFVHHGRGYIGLSQWIERGLPFRIEQHNTQIRKILRKRLLAMTPGEFEVLISQLLTKMGFEMVEVTKFSGDGGIDVRGTLVVGDVVRIEMAVQAKKWKLNNKVSAPVVRQLRGSLSAHEKGLIITTSDFSEVAAEEAVQKDKIPISLMNGEEFAMLLMEHSIGVHRSTPDLFEIDEEFAATEIKDK